MVNLNEIYKCNVCGNIVEVVHASAGTLVCCGQNMQLLNPNTVDAAKEKHVPVIEKTPNGVKVKIGLCSPSNGRKALHRIHRGYCRWKSSQKIPKARRQARGGILHKGKKNRSKRVLQSSRALESLI